MFPWGELQEMFVNLMGIQNYDKFWKTTPREIFALAELKLGRMRHQTHRAIMEDFVEGDS